MLVKHAERSIVGTLPGESFKAKIDENAAVHLMDLLGKGIYEDPEMAVLREYACNAADSHMEAGNPDPIEIWMPAALSGNLLRIVDHGVGLSKDEVIRFLTYYGTSTKRVEGNNQTGSLGIGGKSGFAYGDQFNIIAIKDGKKTTVSASRDEEGGGEFTVVAEEETDERNGVEIQIPARRLNDFPSKAQSLFRYWKKGSVLVNGEEIASVTRSAGVEKIADGLFMTQNSYNSSSVIVMCNVPYQVETQGFGVDIGYNRQILAYVDADVVDFAGNRERLSMTKKTRDSLIEIGQRFKDELQKAMQTEIEACTSPINAIRCATKWYLATPEGMRPKSWTYRGKEIPKEFAIGEPNDMGRRPRMTVVKYHSTKKTSHTRAEIISFTSAIKAQWFYGYNLEFTSGHRRRLDEWANQKLEKNPNWEHPEIYILTDKRVVSEYLDDDSIADWEEVRSIKMPSRERSEHGRLLGSYDAFTGDGNYAGETLADDVDDAEPVYYYVGEANNNNNRWSQSRAQQARPYHQLLRQYESKCTTLLVPHTRVAKLLRTFPDAQRVQDAVAGLFKTWLDTLSDDEKEVLYIHENFICAYGQIKALDASKVNDPELVKYITLFQTVKIGDSLKELDRYRKVDSRSVINESFTDPLQRYPLYSNIYTLGNAPDHLYLYLNAAYQAAQDQAAAEVEELVAEELAA